MGPGTPCAWCRALIPPGKRRDAETCSKPCRQARHRFTSTVGRAPAVDGGHPRRLAYADPPYPGLSKRYYGDHRDYAGEVDHVELVASLAAEYDAWALSTSARALPVVLRLCPPDARVGAWVRGGRPHKDAWGPVSSWEPVIFAGTIAGPRVVEDLLDGSRPPVDSTRYDSLVHGVTPRKTDPERVTGAKPAAFARWVFQLLDARPGDTLEDVYPGSGGIARAWDHYVSPAPGERDTSRVDRATGRVAPVPLDASRTAAASG